MTKDIDNKADRIAGGCMWVYVAGVIVLAVIVCVCIVAFAVWVNI